jgi:hypothetical protein
MICSSRVGRFHSCGRPVTVPEGTAVTKLTLRGTSTRDASGGLVT